MPAFPTKFGAPIKPRHTATWLLCRVAFNLPLRCTLQAFQRLFPAEKSGHRIFDLPVAWIDAPDSRVKTIKTAREANLRPAVSTNVSQAKLVAEAARC